MFEDFGLDAMIVLAEFDQECLDDEDNLVKCAGWVFCSASEFGNMHSCFEAQARDGLSIQMDSTHKLLFNGWALTALNAESVISSTGGKSSIFYYLVPFFIIKL